MKKTNSYLGRNGGYSDIRMDEKPIASQCEYAQKDVLVCGLDLNNEEYLCQLL
jgi:hypothetical protein